jgi:hypothetical protein
MKTAIINLTVIGSDSQRRALEFQCPYTFLAPPSFAEDAFDVNGDLTNVEVEIKY